MDNFQDFDELNDSFDNLLMNSDEDPDDELVSNDEENVDRLVVVQSSDESDIDDEESDANELDENNWKTNITKRTEYNTLATEICDEAYNLREPVEFYELFMRDVWDLLVEETNRYAGQKEVDGWIDVDIYDIKKFIGLCIKMGQVKLPVLRDYWNTSGELTPTPIAASVMARAKFETILQNLHVADNSKRMLDDRLYKISPIINIFNETASKIFTPGKSVCVDESLVPFRGRVVFRQYIPNKRYRYGIKLFKLCAFGGYTCKIKVYAGSSGF